MSHDPRLIKRAQQHQRMGIDELTQVLPNILEEIIDRQAWEGRERKGGGAFQSFYEFATARGWHGLGFNGEDGGITYQDAIDYCEVMQDHVALKMRDEIPALGADGGDRRSETFQGDNITLKRGTDPTYLTRRLKRDAPEIAERLAAGEFKSVRAAAIEAGIVKVPTALDRLRTAWGKATAAERRKFRGEIAG